MHKVLGFRGTRSTQEHSQFSDRASQHVSSSFGSHPPQMDQRSHIEPRFYPLVKEKCISDLDAQFLKEAPAVQPHKRIYVVTSPGTTKSSWKLLNPKP